jgi:phosphotransferase system, enzyme I, PtsP
MEQSRASMLDDLCRIISSTAEPGDMLESMVHLVARKLGTDVCSVYVLNGEKDYLVLQATVGLNPDSVGRIGMNLREGLTGLVLESLKPLFVVHPRLHPRYKYFEGSGEEAYETYMGIPLVYRRSVLGVLVIQTIRTDAVSEADIPVLSTVASQISAVLAYTGLLEGMHRERQGSVPDPAGEPRRTRSLRTQKKGVLRGTPVSQGFADGQAHYMGKTIGFDQVELRKTEDAAAEIVRLEEALLRARKGLESLDTRVQGLSVQDVAILDAQIMYLEDASFQEKILARIREGYTAESALKLAVTDYVEYFRKMDNRYLQERAAEMEDMGRDVLGNLLGLERSMSTTFTRDTILIASDLSPRDLIVLRQDRLKGIALSGGGKTSHTSILARSFEIPMVIGVREVLDNVEEGDYLIVDGTSGILFSRPIREIVDEYERMKEEKHREIEELAGLRELPAQTRDGHTVKLGANIGLLSDLLLVDKYGADHIGLYRTEFPFLMRKEFPSEDEQADLYARMIEGTGHRSTTIRTLDVGGDKFLSYLDYPRENNPYLGWRSIRVSLEMDGPFRTQVRAVLRASAHGKVQILFPMITTVEEIRKILDILEEEKRFLKRAGVPFDPAVPVGIMVEVPGTVRILDRFLRYVDFVSIGTNDLIQYTLAVDRNNQKVSGLYNPLHPAVISLVHDVVSICRRLGKSVSICGEATAQPRCAYLYLGMGMDRMSMNPSSVPVIKQMLRNTSLVEARQALARVLEMETAAEVARFLDSALPAWDGLDKRHAADETTEGGVHTPRR